MLRPLDPTPPTPQPILRNRPAGTGCGNGLTFLSALALFTVLAAPCRADDLAEKGRAVFKKYQHAVVTVQLVLKSKFSVGGQGGQANESRQDVTGTVLEPSGLTVLSLSATDPGQLLQN